MIVNQNCLDKYCKIYNFKYKLMGANVQINSKQDVWFVPNTPFIFGKDKIRLMHLNNKHKSNWHYQDTFSNYYHLFNYIAKHDNKVHNSFNKMFRIAGILKNLQSVKV